MARVMELFVIVNAACGIAVFLGVRSVKRRAQDAVRSAADKVGLDVGSTEEEDIASNR